MFSFETEISVSLTAILLFALFGFILSFHKLWMSTLVPAPIKTKKCILIRSRNTVRYLRDSICRAAHPLQKKSEGGKNASSTAAAQQLAKIAAATKAAECCDHQQHALIYRTNAAKHWEKILPWPGNSRDG